MEEYLYFWCKADDDSWLQLAIRTVCATDSLSAVQFYTFI